MDPSRLLKQRLIVAHVDQDGPPDEMGDPTEVVTYSPALGYVWQTSTTETTTNGTITVEQSGAAFARGTVVDAGDRVIVGGTLDDEGEWDGVGEAFDIDGPPWPALNPRTQLVEYVQARIVRST